MRAASRSRSSRVRSTPAKNASASARGTRSARSCAKYSATLRVPVEAKRRPNSRQADPSLPSRCAAASPRSCDISSSMSGRSRYRSSRKRWAASASPAMRTSPRRITPSASGPASASRLSGVPWNSASAGVGSGDGATSRPSDSRFPSLPRTNRSAKPSIESATHCPASSAHSVRARGERGRLRLSRRSAASVNIGSVSTGNRDAPRRCRQ